VMTDPPRKLRIEMITHERRIVAKAAHAANPPATEYASPAKI
jgi:hypothetical protein